MPQYSPECQPIANKVSGIEADIASLQKDLQSAAPGEKAGLASQIKKAQSDATQQKALLADCEKKHPFQPPPPPPKNPCLNLLGQMNALRHDLEVEIEKALAPLQKDLQKAAPGEKAGLLQQIKILRAQLTTSSPLAKQLAAKQKEYYACLTSNGGLLPLDAKLTGKATMTTTNSHAPGPFNQDITIDLHFSDWDHSTVDVTNFPPISVTYDTHSPAGMVTTTVSLTSGSGAYDQKTHFLTATLKLFFHHSTSLAGDSTLHIDLTSNSPMGSDGSVDLMGSAPFKGGFLDADECSLEVKGKVAPHP